MTELTHRQDGPEGADGAADREAAEAAGGAEGAGPDDTPHSLPITAVTCLEDRAQVERSGVVEVAAGVQRLRIGPVTALAVDRSLRAEAIDVSGIGELGVTVVDARIVRAAVVPPPRPAEDASKMRALVFDLEEETRDLARQKRRLESSVAVVRQAREELHRALAEFAGVEPDSSGVRFDTVDWAGRLEAVDAAEEHRHEEMFDVSRAQERAARRPRKPAPRCPRPRRIRPNCPLSSRWSSRPSGPDRSNCGSSTWCRARCGGPHTGRPSPPTAPR